MSLDAGFDFDDSPGGDGDSTLNSILGFTAAVLPTMVGAYQMRRNTGDVAPAFRPPATSNPVSGAGASNPLGMTVLIVGGIALAGGLLLIGAKLLAKR